MSTQKYASFAVEDLKQGSNLFDNVRATVTNVKFTKEPPNDKYGADGNPIFAQMFLLLAGDAPEEERRVDTHYSLGAQAGDNFTISDDGFGLIPNGDDVSLRRDCKWGTLVGSLQNEGVPKPILQGGDVSKLIGLDGQWKRIADKERNFTSDRQAGNKSKFPPSTLCLVKLYSLPGETAVGKSNGAAAAVATKPAASAPAATAGDLDTETWEILEGVLKAAGGSVQRGRLTLSVSKAANNNPNRAIYAKRASEESFITGLAELGLITYGQAEKGQPVSLAA